MQSRIVFYIITLVSFTLVGCSQIIGSGQGNPIDFTELKSGLYPGYPSEGDVELVISSYTQFEHEWDKIFSNSTNNPELPSVNFNAEKVVMIMLDHKPTGGYGIDSLNVQQNGEKILITYREVQPGNSCITTQAITRPYKLISIPITDKNITIHKSGVRIHECNN